MKQLRQQEAQHIAYLERHDLPHTLDKGESPEAIIWLISAADEPSIRTLGERLVNWQGTTNGVTRILGLDRLCAGKSPQVAVRLLGIPYSPTAPESWIEPVALILADSTADRDLLVDTLTDLIEQSQIARVTSWEQYAYMNR